jgi:nitrate/TMAO reductase-like tetraheme cytochrome c subunit
MSEDAEAAVSDQPPAAAKPPSLLRNYISLAGAAIAFASLASIILMFLIEITAATDNPYLGIFTYIVFPGILIFGLAIMLFGAWRERRRRRRFPSSEIAAFPILDLNDSRQRRSFFVFLGLALLFIFVSVFGSYRAYEYSESVAFCGQACHSVMAPEAVSFEVSAHSRLRCVDCHVGSGAEWYVRSKFSGAYQLYALVFNKYERPIKSPVHNMRPARDTCSKCHSPEKYFGEQLKIFNHFGYDEHNTLSTTRMLIKTGGGSPETGPVSGIHWHMNLANEITYIASDSQRQTIPWVRMKDSNGNITEYTMAGAQLTSEQIEKTAKRTMDCIDCHNRPTHVYVSPDESVDSSLGSARLDTALPFLKQQAVALLSKPYNSRQEGLQTIASGLDDFYRTNYAEVYTARADSVKNAVKEIQRIYRTYSFPEMKTNWQTHPDNIGHYYFQGCFRCHDGQHFSETGKVIRKDCNICHTVLDQTNFGKTNTAPDGAYRHPIELGDLSTRDCTSCHKGDGGFQHPVNLGDITSFKCVDCHAGKVWSKSAN